MENNKKNGFLHWLRERWFLILFITMVIFAVYKNFRTVDRQVLKNTIKVETIEEDIRDIKTDTKEIRENIKEILKKM